MFDFQKFDKILEFTSPKTALVPIWVCMGLKVFSIVEGSSPSNPLTSPRAHVE